MPIRSQAKDPVNRRDQDSARSLPAQIAVDEEPLGDARGEISKSLGTKRSVEFTVRLEPHNRSPLLAHRELREDLAIRLHDGIAEAAAAINHHSAFLTEGRVKLPGGGEPDNGARRRAN